ncbi:hypothetical protein JTB14_035464 [Gonioctena quinquepunctata]|nr:hypothetical protein JTB14_035464 [Gonioctena quinquepunctata]
MEKLFQHELDKHTRSLNDEILNLRKEVQVPKDNNTDLINVLTNKNTQRNEISNKLSNDLDTSFLSCLSADTIVEATQMEAKSVDETPFTKVIYKKRQLKKKDTPRKTMDKKKYPAQPEQMKKKNDSIVGTGLTDGDYNDFREGGPML